MRLSFKQLYKQINPDTSLAENPNAAGHFKDEALGNPLFHSRESVSEIKKRFQR
ncbi:MAG: hypothetical protein ACO1OC_04715 [Tuberibacillus sp.]